MLINESSLTGESEPVAVSAENPFLLSGTKVQDAHHHRRHEARWGKLMATLSEGGILEFGLPLAVRRLARSAETKTLPSDLPASVVAMLLQSIFNNTGGDVVLNQDDKSASARSGACPLRPPSWSSASPSRRRRPRPGPAPVRHAPCAVRGEGSEGAARAVKAVRRAQPG